MSWLRTEEDEKLVIEHHLMNQVLETDWRMKVTNAIRRSVDSNSLLRRCLIVDLLPQGCQPKYEIYEPREEEIIVIERDKTSSLLYAVPIKPKEKCDGYNLFEVPINEHSFSVEDEKGSIGNMVYKISCQIMNSEKNR